MCDLQRIVGFQKEIKGGLIFIKKSTLFYISGQTGVFHILNDDRQIFFPIIEKNQFTAMALGRKNTVALASKGHIPKLTVYNLKSTDKFTLPNSKEFKRFITTYYDHLAQKGNEPDITYIESFPAHQALQFRAHWFWWAGKFSNESTSPGWFFRYYLCCISEYVYISFSGDDEYLAAQGSKPSYPFLIWQMDKRCLLGVFFPFRLESGAEVFKFTFHPKNNTEIITIGRYFFRMYRIKDSHRMVEDAWHKLERSGKAFHSLTWLPKTEKFAVGTSDGMILIFERKQLLQQIHIEKKLAEVPRVLNKIGYPEDKNITCILSTKSGFVCSYGRDSVLFLDWKIDKKDINIVGSVHIPKLVECIEDTKIVQLTLNSSEDLLVAATDNGQIVTFSFNVPALLDSIGYEASFDVLLNQQHKTSIICADTAVNRAVHVTCSKLALLLWDYRKRDCLLWRKFDDDIHSVSIHPLGINLLVGFNKSCRMYNVLNDKLEEIHEFQTEGNLQVKFAEGGHMIAMANNASIDLYMSLSFEKIAQFEDDEQVKCLLWKNHDNHLLSLNKAGKIHEWDVALRTKVWSYSSNAIALSTFDIFKDSIYATTSDAKLCIFRDQKKVTETDIQVKVTTLLVTEHMLLAGCENGKVCGYKLPFSGDVLFETNYHQRSIINMAVTENGKLLLVTGEDCAVSMWKTNFEVEKPISMFDEVLIEKDLYDSNVNMLLKQEEQLKERTAAAEAKRIEQLQSQEAEKRKLEKHCENVENQLNQTLIALTEEKYNLQINIENIHLGKITEICKERDANFADFLTKLAKEEEHFKKLTESRRATVEKYELKLFNLKEEIKISNEKFQSVREKNENRLKELEILLQMEYDARQETVNTNEEFYKKLAEKEQALSDETVCQLGADLKKMQQQNEFLTTEIERQTAVLNYEKEYTRALDAEFVKKKQMYDNLNRITQQVMDRIGQFNKDIQRKESVIEDKTAMIKVLEEDQREIKHMSSEADWRLNECKRLLSEKSEELSKLSTELEMLESKKRQLLRSMKMQEREKFVLDEKLKSLEKSITDSTQRLLKEQLLLDRYRKEFIDATKDIESPVALRTVLLRLLDKTVLRKRIKEEVFIGDTDPFTRFCRQRDHYELLINTVLNREQEIQASFRTTYVNLAKENSDWTAFAEALLRDVKQKQERIEILENCVGLSAKDFSKDPAETQKRFNNAFESLKLEAKEEDEEIQKRIDLIEKQTTELLRLHGIAVVDEKGIILRKIGH